MENREDFTGNLQNRWTTNKETDLPTKQKEYTKNIIEASKEKTQRQKTIEIIEIFEENLTKGCPIEEIEKRLITKKKIEFVKLLDNDDNGDKYMSNTSENSEDNEVCWESILEVSIGGKRILSRQKISGTKKVNYSIQNFALIRMQIRIEIMMTMMQSK